MKRVIISMILALALAFASAGPVMAAGATQGLQDKSGTVQPGAQQAVCPVLGNKINKNIYTDYQGRASTSVARGASMSLRRIRRPA